MGFNYRAHFRPARFGRESIIVGLHVGGWRADMRAIKKARAHLPKRNFGLLSLKDQLFIKMIECNTKKVQMLSGRKPKPTRGY